jgi:glycerol-3-phosphate dehydrogenase (NAD(P)+)
LDPLIHAGEHVAVVGSGTMGTALAHVLAARARCLLWTSNDDVAQAINTRHRHPLHFVDATLAPNLRATTDLGEAVGNAALVVVAVPSAAFRATAREIARFVKPLQIVFSATKGAETGTHKRMAQILAETMPEAMVGAISGPNVTSDIMAERPTPIVLASRAPEAIDTACRFLRAKPLILFPSSDLVGVELAGLLKNVVAIGIGVALGLELGDNACSFIFARGLAEITRLGVALGADPTTFIGLAGVGDLYLTSTCDFSLNRQLGIALGRGERTEAVLSRLSERPEGANAVRACHELAAGSGLRLPIAEALHAIVGGAPARTTFADLFVEEAAPQLGPD